MATNFPGSLDSLTNPSGTSLVTNPDHAAQHANANDAIEAIEAKLGVGSGTPVANRLLFGSGNGTSSWTNSIGSITVTTGTINSSTLGSPSVSSGTLTNSVLNTPTVGSPILNLGSDSAGDVYYRNSGGSVARLGIGTTGQVLSVSEGLPAWANASGKVLQMSMTSYSTESAVSAGTLVETGLAGTITPTSATSRVLVLFSFGDCSTSGSTVFGEYNLARGTTSINSPNGFWGGLAGGGTGPRGNIAGAYLDSPATTSATVYKTRLRVSSGSGTVYSQRDSTTAIMILAEVAA